MALTVNTNVASLTSQRNLSGSQEALKTSLERLSTGLRINSAKDDAAGLAISERFSAQIRGLNQGVRNANDGISLAQTAEGALGEVTNNLQRIRELAVQASNATNTTTDRTALQTEVSALIAEIDRVASQTAFNGTKLLNGGFNGAVFQIGANAGDAITIDSIANSTAANLGTQTTYTLSASATITGIDTLGAINAGTIVISVNGLTEYSLAAIASASSYGERAGQFVAAVNNETGSTGVFAYINSSNTVVLQSEQTLTAAFTLGAGAKLTEVGVLGAVAAVTASSNVSTLSVTTYAASQTAIALVDKALNTINTTRATLGAVQSRFESAVASQQTTAENLASSRSRIQDADFASETANLAKAQILQQSGIAMLAQANAIPQNVLALLQ
jgi:flagellin